MSASGGVSRASADSAVPDGPVEGAWPIGPRVVPPPAGASEELCAILAREPAPQGPPTPPTVEVFKAVVAKLNAASAAKAPDLAAHLNVTIEQSEIQGVPVYQLTPSQTAAEHAGHLFVHVHGGSFALGAGLGGAHEGLQLAPMRVGRAAGLDGGAGVSGGVVLAGLAGRDDQ